MQFAFGLALVIAAGACEGLFSLGVTRTGKWRWENIWGLGSLLALVLVPWPVALLTVPNLMEVYANTSTAVLAMTFLFGLGWGLGGIFWGKAIAALGVALGVSLLMSLITVFGSPVPLAIKEPGKLIEPGGLTLFVALSIMVLGVIICALAGQRKERELAASQPADAPPGHSTPFAIGLLFCAVSGVLSAMVNFGLVFGEPIAAIARDNGATTASAPNAIWALVFTGNYLVNTAYAFYLMFKNKSFGIIISQGTGIYWFWALFMGITWPLGIVLFGIGAGKMGAYGPFAAFPMMLLVAVLFGNLAGALTGEWRGTSAGTKAIMCGSMIILLIAFAVFGMANKLLSTM